MLEVRGKAQALPAKEASLVELFEFPTVRAMAGRPALEEVPEASSGEVGARAQKQKEASARWRQLARNRTARATLPGGPNAG